jgi:hypothetical protein
MPTRRLGRRAPEAESGVSVDRDYEVRAKVASVVGQVLEAHSRAHGVDKQDLVNQVLTEWANKQIHAATLTLRLTRGSGDVKE